MVEHILSSEAMRIASHLDLFILKFIQPAYRARWYWHLTHDPKCLRKEMLKLPRQLDDRYCQRVDGKTALARTLPETLGLYFNGYAPTGWRTTTHAMQCEEDAILSFKAGLLVLVFFHEGWIWHCQREK